jgi:putative nucleotidyltransferase with HDIG domain
VRAFPVRIRGRTLVLSIARDVSEQKRARQELSQSLEHIKLTLEAAVTAIAAAMEKRDPYTAGHQARVARLACAIAERMGLPGEQLEAIRVAGVLHDIGKASIPSEILSKPGPLTELEMGMIKEHPGIAYEILKGIPFAGPVAEIVHQHHERMDGSGYPLGISGDGIRLEARILGVADVVEAMASHRPFRPALGVPAALEEISKHRGILYDPAVADACLELFASNGFELD